MKATSVTSKGQVTIPAPVRAALRLRPHDRVVFEFDPGTQTATIRRVESLSEVFGAVSPRNHPEDYAALREEFERGVAEEVASEV